MRLVEAPPEAVHIVVAGALGGPIGPKSHIWHGISTSVSATIQDLTASEIPNPKNYRHARFSDPLA
jgi:hypothetical protein